MITFQIKKNRKWSKVKATSMQSLNKYCKDNGFSDWRMCGMASRTEMIEDKSLEVVA